MLTSLVYWLVGLAPSPGRFFIFWVSSLSFMAADGPQATLNVCRVLPFLPLSTFLGSDASALYAGVHVPGASNGTSPCTRCSMLDAEP